MEPAETQLSESYVPEKQPAPLRVAASVVSVIFHPLFIPLYVIAFLLYWHPAVFAGFTGSEKIRILAMVAVNLTLLPAATVFLLWRLRFIKNIYLRTPRERIIPYATEMIFAFWCWNVFHNLSYIPPVCTIFFLGTFITVILGWFANIYFKISMHGLAAGGMVFFVVMVALSGAGSSGQYALAAILTTGLIASARLIVSDHRPVEVYAGILLGMASQWLAVLLS